MVPGDTAAEGIIVEQSYPVGTGVDPETAVHVGVSSGPQPVAAPDDSNQSTPTSASATASATATATAPALEEVAIADPGEAEKTDLLAGGAPPPVQWSRGTRLRDFERKGAGA